MSDDLLRNNIVKRLVWDNKTRHGKRVHASGDYVIIQYYPDGKIRYCIQYRGLPLNKDEYKTLKAAQDTAQVHYAEKIWQGLTVHSREELSGLPEQAARIEELEAKLALAVVALDQIAKPKVGPDVDWSEEEVNAWRATWYRKYGDMARATLKELKG